MEQLKIEDLLNDVWRDIELYLHRSTKQPNLQKLDDLKKRIDVVITDAERQLSYTFIELGHNHKGKGHRVDAVMEHAISLSIKTESSLHKEYQNSLYLTDLLEYFLTAMDNLMVNIRSKFSHLQYAHLYYERRNFKTRESILERHGKPRVRSSDRFNLLPLYSCKQEWTEKNDRGRL